LMLCLIAAWAGVLPFDMNQMLVYAIFWGAWSAWILLEWWRAIAKVATEPKGLDLECDREAPPRFIDSGTQ
jgi:hypothetical protein